eukprot:1153665-Pelagomonas_calceolata.AAC.2
MAEQQKPVAQLQRYERLHEWLKAAFLPGAPAIPRGVPALPFRITYALAWRSKHISPGSFHLMLDAYANTDGAWAFKGLLIQCMVPGLVDVMDGAWASKGLLV